MQMMRTLLALAAFVASANADSSVLGLQRSLKLDRKVAVEEEPAEKGIVADVELDPHGLAFEDASLLGLQRSVQLRRPSERRDGKGKTVATSQDSASLLGLQRSVRVEKGPAVEEEE
mmetsp:Transcript_4764/g.8442  ORF Transcript_4764/g.8442 Transcript_4764/m.8442 type:complete len:117 (+) Transcript_4764:64-414(+)|eukprot:CAMPEP_0197660400 /NCGR_PEP_ID=MMETSP1338-20131121/50825_1 /TAXON_ID=43686 ORGANISM="Pelagodinium beii, Strain RCC1491" /NCGR_SAMPLE_ID=MMETSP1338 /ASSEMBLY_ACC=CAM_ASM_000754 /LENGTH=116 /DNA_ID=CAMNT_0043237743 /DNA_START=64 /DNA_END=414 /DNA_ORIENTATION=-